MPFMFSTSVSGGSYREMSFEENQDDIWSQIANASFLEYSWMESDEDLDLMEMDRLEEEALLRECMEKYKDLDISFYYMMKTERLEEEALLRECIKTMQVDELKNNTIEDNDMVGGLSEKEVTSHDVQKSTLNPLAQVFTSLNPLAPEFTCTLNPFAQPFSKLNPVAQEFLPVSHYVVCIMSET